MQILTDIKIIVEKLEQLDAMSKSVADFAQKLKAEQDAFLLKYLDFSKESETVHVFELLKRAIEKGAAR